ncbi:hypothetical protein BDV33DRAFT_182614 [Aspergillus novoparasiticus]|uniref:Uncharacterized protein n=1 Tax=Aspergillus novoparasiticus TaxID=986946 RepID=A0A5N6EAT0_9EURO|nr:hypothetical protein BDV33DRAFT_182614 [Aspergillus novoparasiticus]
MLYRMFHTTFQSYPFFLSISFFLRLSHTKQYLFHYIVLNFFLCFLYSLLVLNQIRS